MSGHITEPLLYIDQPTIEKPKAFMQDYYYSPTKKEEEEQHIHEASVQNETGSFKDLSVEDKIKYLLDLPDSVPKIRCEFITEDNMYRGILLEKKDSEIVVRVLGKENITITIEEINDIQMLGF